MAKPFDPSQVKSTLGWSNSFQPNAAFPLDIRQYFGSYEAAQAAAKTAVDVGSTDSIYHFGMILVVFDGTATKLYTIEGDKSLKEVGAESAQPMKFVNNEAEMLKLTEIKSGQQVYRLDTKTIWIFKGGDASQISNWVESASQNDTTWDGTEDRVIFKAITQQAFDAIATKQPSTLYFLTDTKKIYKGSEDLTSSVYAGESIPEAAQAVKGKLYINTADFTCKITLDGSTWITTSPGYLTDGAEWASADSNKFATIGLIKKGIDATVTAKFAGVVKNPTYNAQTLTLKLPVEGGEAITVNIPKDKFVTAGKYYEDYPQTEGATHHKVIVLTIDNQAEPIIIPAEALVNVYTANNAGKDVTITISDTNGISAAVKIDPIQGNALVSTGDGLKVDISAKMDKLTGAAGGKLVVSDNKGAVSESTFAIKTKGDMGNSATDIPTAALIAKAIETAVNSGVDVSGKLDKLVGATENNLVAVGAEGAIKDSGKKVGGATLNSSPDANTLATEAAVKKAAEDAQLTWGTLS